MKSILLLTDFSENAFNTMQYAVAMLSDTKCKFHVLTVEEPSNYLTGRLLSATSSSTIYDTVFKENKEKQIELINNLQNAFPDSNHSFQTHVKFDDFENAVKDIIEEENIELLFMGATGTSNLEESLFGSSTLRVIDNVTVSALVVPKNYSYQPIKSVLFSEHKEDDLPSKPLDSLRFILKKFEPELHVLQINEANEDKNAETENILENTSLQFLSYKMHYLNGIPTPQAIQAFTQLFDVQLHALFLKKESFIERFIYGSKNAGHRYKTNLPLLILK